MTFHKTFVAAAVLASSIGAHAQVAGAQPLSVTVEQSQALLEGWSVKKSVLGKPVYNDQNRKVGTIRDLIVAPDGSRISSPYPPRWATSIRKKFIACSGEREKCGRAV